MYMETPVKTSRVTFELIETIATLDGAGLTELTEYMDLPQSTVHDHLQTLERLGYLVKENGKYEIGTRFLELGKARQKRMEIYQQAKPEIENIAKETGEHASLMIEEDGLGVLLNIAKGENAVNINAHAGMRMPLTTTAPGKAILAHLPTDTVETYLDEHGMPAVTENTITSRDELFDELSEIQERRYAIDVEERIKGVCAVAVPILRNQTIQGAISVGGPVNRMSLERLEDDLSNMLLQSANVIQVNLTYSG